MRRKAFDLFNLLPAFMLPPSRRADLSPNTVDAQILPAQVTNNLFNALFLGLWGTQLTQYDAKQETYVKHGYQENSDVYSIVSQIATKAASVPFSIRVMEDEPKAQRARMQRKSLLSGGPMELLQYKVLGGQAYQEDQLPIPLDKPNPIHTWSEWIALYVTMLNLTGNVYIYKAIPENGRNAGRVVALYILPSQYIQIVVKDNWKVLPMDVSPVKEYALVYYERYAGFSADRVIHINFPNPDYSVGGAHLYGQSPLRAVLTEMEASNEGNKNALRMMKSGGALGLISGKQEVLEEEQAKQLKQRLLEMRSDPGPLGSIAGINIPVDFTRIALTTQELQPFEYQRYFQKKIANALNWSDKLLNNDEGAKYDNLRIAYKEAILNKLMPDLGMLEDALTENLMPDFGREYDGAIWHFDFDQLPEMQENVAELVEWGGKLLDRGVITRNEFRQIIKLERSEMAELDAFTVPMGIMPLEDALMGSLDEDINPEDA